MAVQTRFCGRCGSIVMPGVTFCGRCGAPVGGAVAAAAGYNYPLAQPGAVSRPRGLPTTQIAVAIGLVSILIIAIVVVTALALRPSDGGPGVCTANCRPPTVTPLKVSSTYRSAAFKFEVDYQPDWTVRSQDANSISLGTDAGLVSVVGLKSGTALDQVIQQAAAALPSATWQDVTPVGTVKGAHIGDQNGLGEVYSANYVGSNGTGIKVRFVVIAATKGGVTVVVMAADPADVANYPPNGLPEGQLFDYLLEEIRWGT